MTEQTFDAYSYQLIESKQKFISQIMTSKSPVRSVENLDDAALSYAEIKMLATGNPAFKEKMQLDMEVGKLKLLKQNHLSQKYAMEDRLLKQYPREICNLEERIQGLSADISTTGRNAPKEGEFLPMSIDNSTYIDKAGAGAAILAACKAKTQPEASPIGSYRGFKMVLAYEGREFQLTLHGALSHKVSLGTDALGNLTRIDNTLNGLATRLEAAKLQLDNVHLQIKNTEQEVAKPFAQENELEHKSVRLTQLNTELNLSTEQDPAQKPIIPNSPQDSNPKPKQNRNTECEYER